MKIHLGDYIKSMPENCGFDEIDHVSTPASKVSLDTEVVDKETYCDESNTSFESFRMPLTQ